MNWNPAEISIPEDIGSADRDWIISLYGDENLARGQGGIGYRTAKFIQEPASTLQRAESEGRWAVTEPKASRRFYCELNFCGDCG